MRQLIESVWRSERHQGQMEYPTVNGSSYIGLIQGYSVQSSTQLLKVWHSPPLKVEYSLPDGRWHPPTSLIAKTWQASWRPNLVLAIPHIRYSRKKFRAGYCRAAEEALPWKVWFECRPMWVLSWLLYDQHTLGWKNSQHRRLRNANLAQLSVLTYRMHLIRCNRSALWIH